MCRANTLHLCSQCLLLPLALTSDSFLAALGLKTKVRVPKHCKHIYSINAWTVLGEPVLGHVLVGIEIQRVILAVRLALVICVSQYKPPMDVVLLQGVRQLLFTVAMCPCSEGARRSANRRPAVNLVHRHEIVGDVHN